MIHLESLETHIQTSWMSWFVKINIKLYIFIMWKCYFMKKNEIESHCLFYHERWTCDILWSYLPNNLIEELFLELRIVYFISKPVKVICDNSVVVFFFKNNKCSSNSKHIELRYLVAREMMWDKWVSIEHINTKMMISH